ncbi:MAG: DNA polymerase I [Erysipelotrichaceae bacterium]|nr:DNA polymerase I [Erysipelotrichaceae bacterium]
MKKMLLVDGYSMLFRAFYATAYGKMMTTKKGIPTNAIYGFANMLQKAIDIVQPDYLVVAFDAGKSTFRNEIFSDYKGTRKSAPEELIPQFQLVRDYLNSFNIKYIEKQGFEADDIIGTIAKRYPEYDINILTSDRDMLQLIDETTSVWLMKKGISEIVKMDEKQLFDDMGISPSQIIELKALMGDTADNIPGIAGIGEKTALKLIEEYKSIENLFQNVDSLKGKLKEKIENGKDSAFMSKKLATIITDADIPVEDYTFSPNYKTLVSFLDVIEMNSIKKRYEPLVASNTLKTEDEYIIVNKIPDEFKKEILYIALDDDKEVFYKSKLNGIAINNGEKTIYINIDDVLKDTNLLNILKSDSLKVGYDCKRDLHILKKYGIYINYGYDVMISSFLCDSTLTSLDKIIENYNLNTLSKELNNVEYTTTLAININKLYFETVSVLKEYDLEDLFYNLELPLSKVLFKMEEEGVNVDVEVLDKISNETLDRINELTKLIYEISNVEFNINSPKQLAEILFDTLKLPANKKRSTSVDVLEKLQGIHPIIDYLMEYRKLQKIYSTYSEGLKKYIQVDGKMHTVFNQCISQTGRLSSTDPNLQNISVKDDVGKQIRRAFLPSNNNVLLSCDYSQVELRVLADMANEKGLIEAFNSKMDIHTKTAMDVFNVSESEVTSSLRRQAKAVNFGIVYGISDFGLAEQLGITRKEAKEFMDIYNEKFPRIHEYMNEVIEYCKENGYVKTLLNRRRFIPQINDKSHMIREFGKRAAMNAPIQGTAADIIKLAMINIDSEIERLNLKSKMILQVHDELIFDVYDDEIEIMKNLIEDKMSNAYKLKVPLFVEAKCGKNWLEAK